MVLIDHQFYSQVDLIQQHGVLVTVIVMIILELKQDMGIEIMVGELLDFLLIVQVISMREN